MAFKLSDALLQKVSSVPSPSISPSGIADAFIGGYKTGQDIRKTEVDIGNAKLRGEVLEQTKQHNDKRMTHDEAQWVKEDERDLANKRFQTAYGEAIKSIDMKDPDWRFKLSQDMMQHAETPEQMKQITDEFQRVTKDKQAQIKFDQEVELAQLRIQKAEIEARKAAKPKEYAPTEIKKLIDERDKYPKGSEQYNLINDKLKKETSTTPTKRKAPTKTQLEDTLKYMDEDERLTGLGREDRKKVANEVSIRTNELVAGGMDYIEAVETATNETIDKYIEPGEEGKGWFNFDKKAKMKDRSATKSAIKKVKKKSAVESLDMQGKSQEEAEEIWNSAPSGAKVIDPNGVTRIKP